MAVLTEGGSECIGNSIQMQKYENAESFPINGLMEVIFGPELDIQERNFFSRVVIKRHMTSYANQ